MLKFCQKIVFCAITAAFSSGVMANCLEDAKKYTINDELYNECLKEAESNDVNPTLHYLIGLWNYTGIYDGDFVHEPNKQAYLHFMYLAAKAGNNEAKAMYVMTEYDIEKAKKKELNPNVVRFLDSLATDKTDEGVLRYLQVKLSLGAFEVDKEEPILKKLADEPSNYEAALAYAQYLQMQADRVDKNADSINVAKSYYDRIINSKDADDSIKGVANWNMYRYYRAATLAKNVIKSEPYLKNLAYMGDIVAQLIYSESFKSTVYGTYDMSQAYAWGALARSCSKNVSAMKYNTSNVDALEKQLTAEELAKGNILLKQLSKDIPCVFVLKGQKPAVKK